MFSAAVLDRVVNPRFEGPLDVFNHYGVAGEPGGGPYLELWLDVADGLIRRAGYRTYPCPAAVACGSLVAQLATGRDLGTVLLLTEADLDLILGKLPPSKKHCLRLAITALNSAAAASHV